MCTRNSKILERHWWTIFSVTNIALFFLKKLITNSFGVSMKYCAQCCKKRLSALIQTIVEYYDIFSTFYRFSCIKNHNGLEAQRIRSETQLNPKKFVSVAAKVPQVNRFDASANNSLSGQTSVVGPKGHEPIVNLSYPSRFTRGQFCLSVSAVIQYSRW